MSRTDIEAMDSLSASISALTSSLHSIFDVPSAGQFAAVFSAALVLPLVCYQVAWAMGKLLSALRRL